MTTIDPNKPVRLAVEEIWRDHRIVPDSATDLALLAEKTNDWTECERIANRLRSTGHWQLADRALYRSEELKRKNNV